MLNECKRECFFYASVKRLFSFFDFNMLIMVELNYNTACMLTSELQHFDTLKRVSMFGRSL